MKSRLKLIAMAVSVLIGSLTAQAALYSSWDGTQTIPDDDISGVAFSFTLTDPATVIQDVTVTVTLTGGWNGDLYAYLSHGSGFAVLLNRVGVGSSSETGYGNPGFAIDLSSAGSANVHTYQDSSPVYDGLGRITGTWQPDGRNIPPDSPASAFDALGSADFSTFGGLDPNGDWTLFFADASPLNVSTLTHFEVDVTPVPEPANGALAIAAMAAAAAAWRWARMRRS